MKVALKQIAILFITMIPATLISMALKTLCALINLPEEPVYMVSTNIYSILCLVFYRCSTNHSRKIKLDELVDTRILRPAEWIRSVWMHENPKALLKEILDSLREKEEKIKMFSVDIQMSKPDEAYQNAADLIREIRTVLMILRRLQEENQISSDKKIDEKLTISDYPTAVNEQLKKINCALAENDLIEAGDLFEYEILPLIDALRNSSIGKEI